jgi:hypothetical protein
VTWTGLRAGPFYLRCVRAIRHRADSKTLRELLSKKSDQISQFALARFPRERWVRAKRNRADSKTLERIVIEKV